MYHSGKLVFRAYWRIIIFTGSSFNPISGSGLSDTNTSGTTTFYAECSNGSGVAATNFVINATPVITATTGGANCGPGTVTLSAVTSAGSISWYEAAITGTAIATGASFTTPYLASSKTMAGLLLMDVLLLEFLLQQVLM
jgi:hypothetical protein